jgi:HK97 family phage major capsid protein
VRRNPNDIKAEISEVSLELEALALTEEAGLDELKKLQARASELEGELDSALQLESIKKEILAKREAEAQAASQPSVSAEAVQPSVEEEPKMKIPAVAAGQRSKVFASSEDAYVSGQYLRAIAGNQEAKRFMNDLSIGTDNRGGFTTPAPLSNALINLQEEYGIARQKCRRIVMSQNTWDVPKLTGHVSINYTNEAAAIGSSDLTFAQVQLVAKKMTALTKISRELDEDSIIPMLDTVVQSIAYALAIEEDTNLFIGKSGGLELEGIENNDSVNDVNVANLGALALTDFTACAAGVDTHVVGARNEWYINPSLFNGAVRDLLNAAGGNNITNIEAGQRPLLLGYPVNFVHTLPAVAGSGNCLAVFGDLNLGCYFGERRGTEFRTLTELYANTDQIGVQCTQRVSLSIANPEVLSKITLT